MYVCVCNYSSQTTEPICIKIIPANIASYADCYRLLRFEIFTPTIFKTPKTQKGREWAFSSQTSKILKLTYLGRGSNDFDEIWQDDAVRHSWPLRTLKISNFENPRWRRPPSWKIEKSVYIGRGSSDFDEIWHTDALITTGHGISVALEGGFD